MVKDVLLLLAGLALIVKGGDLFVAAAIRIAEFLRMPRVVIGSTLVSLTTTTPEMVVSLMSGLKGESGLAVGNALGSTLCNIGLVLGITATIKHVDVHPRVLRMPLVVMLVAGVLLLVMTLDLRLARWQGAVLLLAGTGYFIYDFACHWRDRKPADIAEARAIDAAVTQTRFAWLETRSGSGFQFVAGAAIVVLGSRLLVDGAVDVAARLGVPSIIIGLTVVAVGTSLPELVTAIASSRKSVSDLAVGNVLGANIANLTIIVGIAAVVNDVTMSRATQLLNFPAMLLMMGLLVWTLLTGHRVTRREGVALMTTYAVYLCVLIGMTFLIH
jgi:cation:H+ antiporter